MFWQDSLSEKTTSVIFRVLALVDTFALFLGPFQDFVNRLANTKGIENTHNVMCKVSDNKNQSFPEYNSLCMYTVVFF